MEITFDNGLRYAVSRSLVKLMEIGTSYAWFDSDLMVQ